MSSASPTDSPMTGSPPRGSLVDALYDLFIELPTVDDNGAHLSIGKFRQAMVGMLNEPSPSLGDVSPLVLMGLGPFSFPPRTPPSAFTTELEALRDHLNLRMDALQGAIEGLQRSPLPSAPVPALPTNPPVLKPRVKRPHAQPPTPAPAKALPAPVPAPAPVSRPTPPPAKPSFASMAKAPARPSLVVSLRLPVAGASHPPAVRRSPQEIVEHLNAVLASEDHRVTLSAAWWTVKNNLVVTAGPDTTAHHLTSASHLISDCLATFLSADQSPLPVQTRENCKWARLLVNGIPTGVSLTRGPYSPSELHAALLADNPAYRGLRLTQPPSWEVLNRLRDHHNITHATLLGNDHSTENAPRLPPNGFTVEKNSYVPLTHFLNVIVRAAKECLTPWAARHLSNLRFLPHDEEMLEAVDSKKPLKPNILGLLVRSPFPRKQKISWSDDDVAVIVEVKHGQLILVDQLSTYARCFLSVDRRRSFFIAIAFDNQTLQMHFLIFHRSGLSSSHGLSLHSEAGFQCVVKHMVGIPSIPDEEAFGLDKTRSGDVYRINNRDYEIVRPIHTRISLDLRVVHPACTPGTRDTTPPRSRWLTLPDGVTELPEEMVYKLSYQTEGHSPEGNLLSGSLGQFGIVDIVGSYICTSEDAPFGSTAHHVRNSTFWRLSDQSVERSPDNRYLHCTAMPLEGLPLLYTSDIEAGIPSPVELLESILHAMIGEKDWSSCLFDLSAFPIAGHHNLYLGGVLHRDVSNGNILRLREPIERPHSRIRENLPR
ncbi:hypothetical protein EDB84DRAFT_1611629 [Lactarius hengduanensis]|nr:hypothetical protein EDB84DRAFT_1611629 [Lactarius hengduanensis]